jgi:membrane protein required for colicin V production
MSWVDWFIISGCCASAAFGAWRGFTKETLSLVTWLAAVWVAWRFTWVVEPMLGEWIATPEIKIWIARGLIFMLILIIGGRIAWLFRRVIRGTGLSGADRFLGLLLGFGRGIVVLGLFAIILESSSFEENSWWQEAKIKPYGDRVAEGIRFYVSLGSLYIQEQDLV